MRSAEFIQRKFQAWAHRQKIKLQGSEGERGQPNYTFSCGENMFGGAPHPQAEVGHRAILILRHTRPLWHTAATRWELFERYTEAARRVLFFARYEVTNVGGAVIEPEHILLGLCREPDGLVGRILAGAGASAQAFRHEIESRLVGSEKIATSVEIPFSAETKRLLETAVLEADDLRNRFIRPEHLLLGVLRADQSMAAAVLRAHGIQLNAVREEIAALLESSSKSGAAVSNPLVSGLEDVQELLTRLDVATTGNEEAHLLIERVERKIAGLTLFVGGGG